MTENNLVYLSVDLLHPHPDNPRKDLGDLSELADSIKVNGVMQNLTVVPRSEGGYTILIGHRRCAGAKLAGLEKLPCIIVEMTPQEQISTMLLENILRHNLTVYEEAQAFQMMIDLGESPESIAEKTGFSSSTVRRRLKMSELDQNKLKAVCSERQISIGDIDMLSKVKDQKSKDDLLDVIGTKDFDYRVKSVLIKQSRVEHWKYLEPAIKKMGGKKLSANDKYSVKYERISSIDVEKFNEGDTLLIDGVRKTLYYFIEINWSSTCEFYTEAASKPKIQKSKKQIAREKYVNEVTKQLQEITVTAFRCRVDFVKALRMEKKDAASWLEISAMALISEQTSYNYGLDDDVLKELFGQELFDLHTYSDKMEWLRSKACGPDSSKMLPLVIYRSFGDRKEKRYYSLTGPDRFPVHEKSISLDWIYDFLCFFGYKMSSDEKMLKDGTHPLFIDKDYSEE